jgi:ankyrin repeat protein
MFERLLAWVKPSKEKELCKAVTDGDLPMVKQLLADGADVNVVRWNGESPLRNAAAPGNVAILRHLLSVGARPNDASVGAATETGNIEILEALFSAGADPNAVWWGEPAIVRAVSCRPKMEVVKKLLDAGADPNAKGSICKRTALMYAAESRCGDAVKALLAAGADPHACDVEGHTVLMLAAEPRIFGEDERQRVEIAKVLLQAGVDPNAKMYGRMMLSGLHEYWTALDFAANNPELAGIIEGAGGKRGLH